MAKRVDTWLNRNSALRALNDGSATTYWVATQIRRLNNKQAYRLLRRMEADGLVRRDDKMRGLWHRQDRPIAGEHHD